AAARTAESPEGSRAGPRSQRSSCIHPHGLHRRTVRAAAVREYDPGLAPFETPTDLMHNRGLIDDPEAFARERGAASWLYLCGEEFAAVEGGMSYEDVRRAVPVSANVVSDPPTPLDLDLARRQLEALESLPRPTLVTCRTGPRSAALIYLYGGLRAGASAEDVLARAELDDAPFVGSPELRAWLPEGLEQV